LDPETPGRGWRRKELLIGSYRVVPGNVRLIPVVVEPCVKYILLLIV
jgi:hypothetical protein